MGWPLFLFLCFVAGQNIASQTQSHDKNTAIQNIGQNTANQNVGHNVASQNAGTSIQQVRM